MSDPNPPQPFNWNLPPKKPEEPVEPVAQQPPPQWPTQPPVAQSPLTQPPVAQQPPAQQPPPPPPSWSPVAQQAPPPQWPAATPPPTAAPPTAAPPPPVYNAPPPPTQGSPAFPTGSYGFPPTAAPPTAPPPTAPPAAPAPGQPAADVPTQSFAYDPFATQAFPFDGALSGATEVLGAQPVGLPELRGESVRPGQASAIDALFGESQFKEYEAGAFPSEGISALSSGRPREPREPLGTTQKVLLIVGASLVAVLALIGLFVAGTKLPALFPPAPEPEAVETSAPTIPAQPVAVGPVAAGAHEWNDLLGTECLDPYVSAWQEQYTVVDCTAPHAAQMVHHGYFADEAWAPYPGLASLQSRINLLCTSPASVDYSVASQFADIQIAASYAATEEEWVAGERDYYCFVSRSSLEPLTTSVAVAVVPAEGLTATVPGNDP